LINRYPKNREAIMAMKQQPNNSPENQPTAFPAYDSKPLTTALVALSEAEIDSMLHHISSLEAQIAKLSVGGVEDEMMHMVTDGLRRLNYFLDAVKRHKNEIGDQQTPPSASL
jgi:hypothetical protein